MKAGKLRHWVTFETPREDQDADGQPVPGWVYAFGPVPAEIAALSGGELLAAQAEHSHVSTRIKVRYREGITPQMRIYHLGTVYNILAVIPDPFSGIQWVTLLCESGLSDG
jgi:SPP1 family predicted phage head-tail adaptor